MATLTIRNVPDDVHAALRMKAAASGRSMEAEARGLIINAVTSPSLSKDERLSRLRAIQMRIKEAGGVGTVDEFLAERRALWGEKT
jgi:plasmid stability protein